jgi:hypothetical protein
MITIRVIDPRLGSRSSYCRPIHRIGIPGASAPDTDGADAAHAADLGR